MLDFKTKRHQIWSWLGLCPAFCFWSSQHSPSWISWVLLPKGGREREGEATKKEKGERMAEKGTGKEWNKRGKKGREGSYNNFAHSSVLIF